MIGTWEFKPGVFPMTNQDRKVDAMFDTWHTKFAAFNTEGSYIFTFKDSTQQVGKWDISSDGKILILTSMSDVPKEFAHMKELRFPIRIKKKALHITYPLNFERPPETPFDNIVKPVYGEFNVEIKYFRSDE
jgi:hypothetical protein